MVKKILILGGAIAQIPAIKYAKESGYYVITCDYLPKNPGHQLSDEYHNVSTTDMDAILALALKLKIDGIVAYASDPAAPTAAYVAEKMKISKNTYSAINTLAKKTLFRDFLHYNNFNAPKSIEIKAGEDVFEKVKNITYPVMVKPDDSSGSKGVSKITNISQLKKSLEYAAKFSRNGKCIVEEFVNKTGRQIGGDAFVYDGKVVFIYLGDQYVNENCNPFVPTGLLFPTILAEKVKDDIRNQIQRVIDILEIKTCAINIEVMIDSSENIYLMELGPRNGGNFIPQIIKYATGVDLVRATVDVSLGEKYNEPKPVYDTNAYAYYAIHSEKDGVLDSIKICNKIDKYILEKHIYVSRDEMVSRYNGSNSTIGIILFRFPNCQEGINILNFIKEYIIVTLK